MTDSPSVDSPDTATGQVADTGSFDLVVSDDVDRYWEQEIPPRLPQDQDPTYKDHIAPSLNRWCGECHLGPTDWDCSGASICFVSFPEMMLAPGCCDAEDPFGTCEYYPQIPGTTLGHCVLARIEATKRGDTEQVLISKGSPIMVPDSEVEMIRRWINVGQPFE